jgi:hypothetical protein
MNYQLVGEYSLEDLVNLFALIEVEDGSPLGPNAKLLFKLKRNILSTIKGAIKE